MCVPDDTTATRVSNHAPTERMAKCPECDTETKSRLAIIDPSELREEREYCVTCDTFLDEEARPAPDS